MDYKRKNTKDYKLSCPSYTPIWNKYKNFVIFNTIFNKFDKLVIKVKFIGIIIDVYIIKGINVFFKIQYLCNVTLE